MKTAKNLILFCIAWMATLHFGLPATRADLGRCVPGSGLPRNIGLPGLKFRPKFRGSPNPG